MTSKLGRLHLCKDTVSKMSDQMYSAAVRLSVYYFMFPISAWRISFFKNYMHLFKTFTGLCCLERKEVTYPWDI